MSSGSFRTGAFSAVIAGMLATVALVCAPAASASVEYGRTCLAFEEVLKKPTLVEVNSATAGTIETVGPGVVTSWKVGLANLSERVEKLKVFKGFGTEFEAVAESAPQTVRAKQLNEFPARIPVAAGVRFGANTTSEGGVAVCRGIKGDSVAYFNGDVAVGTEAAQTGFATELVTSLSVVVEPDADGDGYGDETQDGCPESAASHTVCPPPVVPPSGGPPTAAPSSPSPAGPLALTLESRLEGNAVVALVASSQQAPITVTGSLKGKPVTGPVTVTVAPGQIGRAYLRLPPAVNGASPGCRRNAT